MFTLLQGFFYATYFQNLVLPQQGAGKIPPFLVHFDNIALQMNK